MAGKRTSKNTNRMSRDNPNLSDHSDEEEEDYAAPLNNFSDISQRKISRPNSSTYNSSTSSLSKKANTPPFSFQQMNFSSAAATTTTLPSNDNEESLHIHGLNKSFQKSIDLQISKNPSIALSSILKQYETYISDIKKKYSLLPSPSSNTMEAKPFTFSSSTTDAKPFTFSSNTTEAKPFNFGTSKPSTGFNLPVEAKSSSITDAKPFTFSSSITDAKPFSFSSSTTEAKPAIGFNFFPQPSNITESSPFSFSLPQKNSIPSNPNDSIDDGDGDGDDDGEHPDSISQNEQKPNPELIRQGEGEEDDVAVLEVRSKLFQYTKGSWTDLGIILFKVNRSKESNRYRALARSQGTGKLLLNNWISGGAKALLELENDPPRKNDLQLTLLTSEGFRKYILRSKDNDGAQLLYGKLKEFSN